MVYFLDFVSSFNQFGFEVGEADFKLSGSELVRILEMTVPFMDPRKTESGWHDVRWRY